MPICPNCGGEMKYERRIRLYVCKGCGLSLSRMELDALRDKKFDKYDERDIIDEYYEWWTSRKR